MPLPIKPMHELEKLDGLFSGDTFGIRSDSGLSDLQSFFLGDPNATSGRTAGKAKKYSARIIAMLEEIEKGKDPILTATAGFKGGDSESIYRVPRDVSDNELLGLKAEGLVSGNGRAVKITTSGRVALRDRWLKEPNQLLENRDKDKFVHPANPNQVTRASATGSKFVRTAKEELPRREETVIETVPVNNVPANSAQTNNVPAFGPDCPMCSVPTNPLGQDGYHDCHDCGLKMKGDLSTHGRVDPNAAMRDRMRDFQNSQAPYGRKAGTAKFTRVAQPYLDDSHLHNDDYEADLDDAYNNAMQDGCPHCEANLADHPNGDLSTLICSNPKCAREFSLLDSVNNRRENRLESRYDN